MKRIYHKPEMNCYTMDFQACIAASNPKDTTLYITDENVDTSHKARRHDLWDDEEENDF